MPEGPEVRTVADKLAAKLVGLTIHSTWISAEVGISITGELQQLIGSKITMVASYGKKLLIYCDNKMSLVIGLGMTGRFLYQQSVHSQVALMCTSEINGQYNPLWVFYEDSRRFGHVDVCNEQDLSLVLSKLGPDLLAAALSTEITSEIWISRFPVTSTRKIFEVLKDQSTVSGIGNYLASEILYYSSIHPLRQVRSLTLTEWEKLRQVSHQIIKLSYYHGGFTLESFISPDGMMGTYPAAVYGRKVDPQGYHIEKLKIGNQNAHFVAAIQLAPL